MRLQVLQCLNYLYTIALGFDLSEAFPAFDHLAECLVLAQLQDDVDVLRVLEEMLEADDVLLVHGPVDADLTHQLRPCFHSMLSYLLLRSGFGEGGLRHDFGSREFLSLQGCELIALSESTLHHILISSSFLPFNYLLCPRTCP